MLFCVQFLGGLTVTKNYGSRSKVGKQVAAESVCLDFRFVYVILRFVSIRTAENDSGSCTDVFRYCSQTKPVLKNARGNTKISKFIIIPKHFQEDTKRRARFFGVKCQAYIAELYQ